MILTYSKSGIPVNDFEVEEVYKNIIHHLNEENDTGGSYNFSYSTENIFSRVRLGIVSGDISPDEIRFFYEGELIKINKYGAILHWPKGFLDLCIDLSEKIIRKAIEKIKEEK
jgi:hypothetical protein